MNKPHFDHYLGFNCSQGEKGNKIIHNVVTEKQKCDCQMFCEKLIHTNENMYPKKTCPIELKKRKIYPPSNIVIGYYISHNGGMN